MRRPIGNISPGSRLDHEALVDRYPLSAFSLHATEPSRSAIGPATPQDLTVSCIACASNWAVVARSS
jgi:hypothetical protein